MSGGNEQDQGKQGSRSGHDGSDFAHHGGPRRQPGVAAITKIFFKPDSKRMTARVRRKRHRLLTFVGTNLTDESIVSDLPVVPQLFGNPMLCTLLTQRLPYFEVSGDSCLLWPPF
jgi:hypothetical protein